MIPGDSAAMDEPTLGEIYRVLLEVREQQRQTNGRLREAEVNIRLLQAVNFEDVRAEMSSLQSDIADMRIDRAAAKRAAAWLVAAAGAMSWLASAAAEHFIR